MELVSDNKRIAKNTILLYLRTLLTMAISLYTSRVILQVLGVEDYGIYNVVGGFVTLMSFITGAITTSTTRYITFALGKGDEEQQRFVFSTSLLAHFVISAIIVILGETIGLWFVVNKLVIPETRLLAAHVVYQLSLASSVIYLISIPYNACIIAHEKMSAFAYISIYEAVTKLLVVFVLIKSLVDRLILYAILLLVVQLSVRFIYSLYCRKHFKESRFCFIWKAALFKEMISFAGWNLFGSLAYALFTQGINVLLNIFFGPAVNTARGLAVQVQSAVSLFATNFQSAINPQITKTYASSDMSTMHSLIIRSTKFSFGLLFCLSLPLIVEPHFILNLWLKDVPDYTTSFLRLVLVICIIEAMANPIMVSAAATGKVKVYQSVCGTIQLLIIPIAYLVLKMGCPPESVFIVHIIIASVTCAARLLIIRSLIKLSIRLFLTKAVLPCVLVALCSYLFMHIFKMNLDDTIFTAVITIVLSVIIPSILFFLIGMSKTERVFIINRIQRMVNC